MMRLLVWIVAISVVAIPQGAHGQFSPSPTQGNASQRSGGPSSAQSSAAGQRANTASDGAAQQSGSPGRPFPPLSPEEQQRLDELLMAWQEQSQATQRLECSFTRWHYDLFQAPSGVYATKAQGQLRYAAPDKGLFRVDTMSHFKGLEAGKPKYEPVDEVPGEYWVCTGKELLQFDREKKVCTIKMLPPDLQGKQIFESPLPFVFNLDAEKIKKRYWVRIATAPHPGAVLVEAYPKLQADRSQYKVVQVVIDEKTFLPKALVMYAPNFHERLAPTKDIYEFTDVQRNSMKLKLADFVNQFIPQLPNNSWKVIKEHYQPPAEAGEASNRQATRPQGAPAQQR